MLQYPLLGFKIIARTSTSGGGARSEEGTRVYSRSRRRLRSAFQKRRSGSAAKKRWLRTRNPPGADNLALVLRRLCADFVALHSSECRQRYNSRRSRCWQKIIYTARCCRRVIGMRHADLRPEATVVVMIAEPASALLYGPAVWHLVWVCECVLYCGG